MLENGYNPQEFLVRFRCRPIIKDKILISNLHIWLRPENQTYEVLTIIAKLNETNQ
jgi:hypothetical protein